MADGAFGRILGKACATVDPEPGQVGPVLVPAIDEHRHVGSPLDVADAGELARVRGLLRLLVDRREQHVAVEDEADRDEARATVLGDCPERGRPRLRRRSWRARRSRPCAHAAGTGVCFRAPCRCFHSCGTIAGTDGRIPACRPRNRLVSGSSSAHAPDGRTRRRPLVSAIVSLRWKHRRSAAERECFRRAPVRTASASLPASG